VVIPTSAALRLIARAFLRRCDGNPGNAMKFVVGSELYDHLEKVVDRFEDVANEISSIVVDQL
jgi:uncharacterized protein